MKLKKKRSTHTRPAMSRKLLKSMIDPVQTQKMPTISNLNKDVDRKSSRKLSVVSFLNPKQNKAPLGASSFHAKKVRRKSGISKIQSLYRSGKLSSKGLSKRTFIRKSKIYGEDCGSSFTEKTIPKPPPTVDQKMDMLLIPEKFNFDLKKSNKSIIEEFNAAPPPPDYKENIESPFSPITSADKKFKSSNIQFKNQDSSQFKGLRRILTRDMEGVNYCPIPFPFK
jgi:hypothetical protein